MRFAVMVAASLYWYHSDGFTKEGKLQPSRVIRVAAYDAPELVAYKVTLWGTLTFYALILGARAC